MKLDTFWRLDRRFWNDRIHTNRYFSTISLLVCLLLGICAAGGHVLASFFDWDLRLEPVTVCVMLTIVWGMNVAETIMASDKISIMILRPLLLLVVFVGTFGLAYAGVMIALALLLIWFVFTMLLGSGKKVKLTDGTILTNSSFGNWTDKSGRTWNKDGNRFSRED